MDEELSRLGTTRAPRLPVSIPPNTVASDSTPTGEAFRGLPGPERPPHGPWAMGHGMGLPSPQQFPRSLTPATPLAAARWPPQVKVL